MVTGYTSVRVCTDSCADWHQHLPANKKTMNNTKVITLLTVDDVNIVATTIAVTIVSAQRMGGEEHYQDEIERIVENALHGLAKPERRISN